MLMGLIRTLLGYSDPARKWQAVNGLPLRFVFDDHSLGGVKLGAAWYSLSVFGPPEMRRHDEQDSLVYLSKGFSADLVNSKVNSFSLVWNDYLGQGFKPFQGDLSYHGKVFSLGVESTESELVDVLGEPFWRDADEDEIILFYEQCGTEWQIELDAKGKLKTLLILAHPLLASEEQREAYKVDKPWPPA